MHGQDPNRFVRVTRDRTDNNVHDTSALTVPRYETLPTVSHVGQLAYDMTNQCLVVSVKELGLIVWKPLEFKHEVLA